MKTIRFTREELYDLVWKKPMGQISRLHGLSNYGIRQACTTLVVPLSHAILGTAQTWLRLES